MLKRKLQIGIAGYGRLGRALHTYYQERDNVANPRYEVYVQDLKAGNFEEAGMLDILNICFPYRKHFVSDVLAYLKEHHPFLCLLHTEVKPGTTKEIRNWIQNSGIYSEIAASPIIGPKNDLLRSLRLFKKMLGYDSETAKELATIHLRELGFQIFPMENSTNAELAILVAQSGRLVDQAWAQQRARICKTFQANENQILEVINQVWNPGFAEYGKSEMLLPVEKAKVIAPPGLQPVCLLNKIKPAWILNAVLKSNRRRTKEEAFKRPLFIYTRITLMPFKRNLQYLLNRIDELRRILLSKLKKSSKIK